MSVILDNHNYTETIKSDGYKYAGCTCGKPLKWEGRKDNHTEHLLNLARAESLTLARQLLKRITPNGLINKANVLSDLEEFANRAANGIKPNGNPYTEES